MSGHVDDVSGIHVADKCGVGAACSTIVASCSIDCSVRLWSMDKVGRGDEECVYILHCGTEEPLDCVAITPDAQRVVAGGIGFGDSVLSSDNVATYRGYYSVHVWTRRGAATCSSATADASEYATIELAGHSDRVRAIQVSRDGGRIVSGSEDLTVRVWSLPPHAAVTAADVGAPRVVDMSAATPGIT
jgi:WD40 repeat protein